MNLSFVVENIYICKLCKYKMILDLYLWKIKFLILFIVIFDFDFFFKLDVL